MTRRRLLTAICSMTRSTHNWRRRRRYRKASWPVSMRKVRNVVLVPSGFIPIPPHAPSEFDHGDVHVASGQVFVAHTAAGTVEVLDGARRVHLATIPGCAEASGVLVAQE